MANTWRAQHDDGTTAEDFRSSDFDPVQLEEDHSLPLNIIDLTDVRSGAPSRVIGRVEHDAGGFVTTRWF